MGEDSTIWPLEPHTKTKHQILERYLKAWFPIMSRYNKKILYVDGFSGPGIYSNGESGSPIIALNVAINHVIELKTKINFMFIEQDKKRCECLENEMKKLTIPENCSYFIYCDSFENKLNEVFSKLDDQDDELAPSFVFIDPFGYAQTSFKIIEKIMSYQKCEILITFVYDYINRFIKEPDREHVFNSLFGTDEWKAIDNEATSEGRKKFIHDLYLKQLQNKAKVKYIRSFQILNKFGHTEYFLIYGTNNIKGLKEMKEAMWKVDNTGEYTFSDNTDPNQTVLFELEPNYGILKRMIVEKFRGKFVSIEEIEEFVIESTPFLIKHIRKPILIPMENSYDISILSQRRKNSYPEGCKIKFI